VQKDDKRFVPRNILSSEALLPWGLAAGEGLCRRGFIHSSHTIAANQL